MTPGTSYEEPSFLGRNYRQSHGSGGGAVEPMNILNVAIRVDGEEPSKSDQDISQRLAEFCQAEANRELLTGNGVRRITFTVVRSREFPKYFTFRSRSGFEEDLIYRHLEPALAFQLELNRLKNYHLDPVQTANHKMHLYLGRAKVSEGRQVSDHRFFIRSIIRHSDLLTR